MPKNGAPKSVSALIQMTVYNSDPRKLLAVGCEWTNVNTGWRNGTIKALENHEGHALHWRVCLLHCNELPLRYLSRTGWSNSCSKILHTTNWKRA